MDDYDYSQLLPHVEPLAEGGRATLLVGTDRHIGKADGNPETRVGITPYQARALHMFLTNAGIKPTLFVIHQAGEGAGFSDVDYQRAGCRIVREEDLPSLPCAPDVLHALKEPSPYERHVPGPFLRIGALHTGTFSKHPAESMGLRLLLESQRACGIFDGSSVGDYSYQYFPDRPRIPIRHWMSVIAGEIAAQEVIGRIMECNLKGHIVVCGGGVVGSSAVRYLLSHDSGEALRIVLVEASEDRRRQLASAYSGNAHVEIIAPHEGRITAALLHGVAGLIFAQFLAKDTTPEVVRVEDLLLAEPGAAVIDVASDEGGSIALPAGANGPRDVASVIAKQGNNLHYVADTHLPRREPHRASELHGRGVLPYLAMLLYLCAREGGPAKALYSIQCTERTAHKPPSLFDALAIDLKNGLAFTTVDTPVLRFTEIVKDPRGICETLRDGFFGVFELDERGLSSRPAGLLARSHRAERAESPYR